METTGQACVPYVFRLLARTHPAEQKLSGGALEQSLAILQGSEFSGILTLETRTGLLARILFERGRLLHALRGDLEGAPALEQLRAEPGFNAIALHPLEGPALALALAFLNTAPLLALLRREFGLTNFQAGALAAATLLGALAILGHLQWGFFVV
ncbi:MAG: hypothetical protein C4333_10360, partial [Meiothermus sp.]